MRGTDTYCDTCGAELQEYDVIQTDTGMKIGTEVACPYEWKEGHE